MADDVKVKFGGDFSDIDKDAQSASKRIGTALGAWVNDYAGEVKHKLKDAFSLGNILEKFGEGVKEYFKKFDELENMSKKLGVSVVELQQFGKLGREAGVDMETMGRSIAFANKALGGMKDNEKLQKLMLDLGFSTDQVRTANIKSLDVLYKLADAYEKTKEKSGEVIANNELAKRSSEVFGRAGYELNGVIKEGTEALKERIETMKVFSDTEVKVAAMTAKLAEKGAEDLKRIFYGNPASLFAWLGVNTGLFGALGNEKGGVLQGGVLGKSFEQNGIKDFSETLNDPKKMEQIAKTFSKKARAMGLDKENLVDLIEARIESSAGLTGDKKEFYRQLQVKLESMSRDERNSGKNAESGIPLNGQVAAISASSLQQIGGGDVSSVMGVYGVADNIRRTAEATEKMAEQDQSPTIKKTITSVAK